MWHALGSMLRINRDSADCACTGLLEVRGMSTLYPCMSRGTTTMKMISSTSTTSTSGVMLISDCRLEPESPVLNCMTSFPLRASLLGDQPHTAEAGLVNCDHDLPDCTEIKL